MTARSNVRSRWSAAVLALALGWPGALAAQHTAPPPPAAYALKGVTVVQADGRRAEGVTLVVRGQLIEALAPGAQIPADAQLLEGDSLFVYPGLVDAQGAAKFEFPRVEIDRQRLESWNPPRAAQGFMPHRRVVDALQATGADLKDQRKKGVVAAAVHPADALVPGRGALVLFRADAKTSEQLVLTPVLGPLMTLQGARGTYPSTLFAVLSFYRQSFDDASRMKLVAAEYARDPRGLTPPAYDPDYAVLQEAMGGSTPVFFQVQGAEDIRRVLDLSDRYKLKPVIVGGDEAWQVADLLKAKNVPVLVSLDFPKAQYWKPEEKKDAGALDVAELKEKKRLEEIYANAGKLAQAGVRFALTSGGGKADLRDGARKAIEYGLTEGAALRALTQAPAELFGTPNLARLETGFPATFVVSKGALFGKESHVVYTFVEGALERGDAPKEPANGGRAQQNRARPGTTETSAAGGER